MSAQPDLFAPLAALAPPSKRHLRAIRRQWQSEVESWAERALSWDLLLEDAAAEGNELIAISVDGSGPSVGWRKSVIRWLAADYEATGIDSAQLRAASDPPLVKAAIRIGRLPRSIIVTMPRKPAELPAGSAP
jgi:hypothetical protein